MHVPIGITMATTSSTYQWHMSYESGDREKLHPHQTLFERSQKRPWRLIRDRHGVGGTPKFVIVQGLSDRRGGQKSRGKRKHHLAQCIGGNQSAGP